MTRLFTIPSASIAALMAFSVASASSGASGPAAPQQAVAPAPVAVVETQTAEAAPAPAEEPVRVAALVQEEEEPQAMTDSSAEDPNAAYNDFLAKYVVEENGINLIRYGAVSEADHQALKGYVSGLEGMKPSQMSRDEALAYWFNLYNAKTIDIILDNYPVDSIRDIGGSVFSPGPWKKEVLTVEGKAYSLDNIEHDTVRATYDEPRVHYAFNCASIGCPNLKSSAWVASSLEAELDEAARIYVAHPRGVRVENGRVTASNIYKWFKKDFGNNDKEVLAHIIQYASGDKKAALEAATSIRSYEYDWNLNLAK